MEAIELIGLSGINLMMLLKNKCLQMVTKYLDLHMFI